MTSQNTDLPTNAALCEILCSRNEHELPDAQEWAWIVAQRINAVMMTVADQYYGEIQVYCEHWPEHFSQLVAVLKQLGYEAERLDRKNAECPHALRVAYVCIDEGDAFVLPTIVMKNPLQVWGIAANEWLKDVI